MIKLPVSYEPATWLDGTPTTVLPLPSRGLDFGDGLFETLLVREGQALFAGLHMERLQHGMVALAIPDCLTNAIEYMRLALRAVDKENWRWAVLRLSVIRGDGPRGYTPVIDSPPHILIQVSQLNRDCGQMSPAATLSMATVRLSAQPLLAGIKHLNRLEQVLAAAQAQSEGVDECVVMDQFDRIISVIAGNLFLVRGGEILTPELADCGVLGTRRRLIIDKWAPAIGLRVREARLTSKELEDAEEVFYSNSLHTVRPVARLRNHYWDSYPVSEKLYNRYREELRSCKG